jgi:hypothetical protein
MLAKTFYDDGLLEFAIRELIEARKYSESPTLHRLLEAFGDHARRLGFTPGESASPVSLPSEPGGSVAEIELEMEFDTALEKLK